MKRILIGLLAAAVSTLSTMGVEDNNPCTHDWGDKQYDCDTWIREKSHDSLPCSSATVGAVKSAALSATETGGSCRPYRVCNKCHERDDLTLEYLGGKSASYNGEERYDMGANKGM